MNMVAAASLSTATAVASPTARAQPGPQEVSFPPGLVDRLVRIRERSFIQRQKDKAHRLAGTDPFDEDGDKVWNELQEEQCAAADAILSSSPQSIADLAWQAEAVLICDGPEMSESKEVYGLVQLFENVRALAGPLAIPSAVSFPQVVDPVFAEIERHKALSVAFDTAAENSTATADSHPDKDDLDEISGQASSELIEQAQKLFEFRPASLGGIAALLKYIASLKDWQLPGRFGEPEEIEGMQDLCRTMAAAIEPFSAVRRVATSSSNAGRDPILAAIEAHRSALTDWLKAVDAADQIKGERPTARVLVGTGTDGEAVRTELEGGGFSVAWVPNGKTYPIYVDSDVAIERNAPKALKSSDREAWISERLAELEAEERRITKRHARTKLGKLEAARHKASDLERERVWDLIWTVPTTPEGLAALLRYCRERESVNELVADDAWEDALEWTLERAACALAGMPEPPMSKVVASLSKAAAEWDPAWRVPGRGPFPI
jgi:hypothetical protein